MPSPPDVILRMVLAVSLGLAGAIAFDRLSAARRLQPPGFKVPWRRALALTALAGLLALGVFSPVVSFGLSIEPDPSEIRTPQLFALHFLMLGTMAVWFLLGFSGISPQPAAAAAAGSAMEEAPPPPRISLGRQFLVQFGLRAPSVPREIGLGLALGLGAWIAVLLALFAIALLLLALGGEEILPKQPPALVPLIAGLPIAIRLLISLSAGLFEECFFRGFLQPRIGIPLSTAFFVLAHLSYGQPFMLVGITLLSVIYALLVKWRQNLWPAIAAHALFDGVQLLVVVPFAMKLLQGDAGKAAWLAGLF